MTHLRRGRMWSLTQNQPVKPSEALPEQLDLPIIAGPSQLNYSILIKKKETTQLHLIKLFTKQSVSENNSFHLPVLCKPVLGLVWDIWIWERAWQTDFRCALMNIYNLEKKHTCSGISHLSAWKFPIQFKAIYRSKGMAQTQGNTYCIAD